MRADIASIGASLRSLRSGDRDLVVPFAAEEVRPAYRGALLAPWPNRVVNGSYRRAGRDYQLPLTEADRGHALHGLLAWDDFASVRTPSADRVVLAAEIVPSAGYPWRVRVESEFVLDGGGLTQTVRATNIGDGGAPWGTAPHPYLTVAGSPLDDCRLELPAAEVLTVTEERLEPLTVVSVAADREHADRFDFRSPRTIGGTRLDHAFTRLMRTESGQAVVRLTDAAGAGVAMRWGSACEWVQVHTADLPGCSDPSLDRIGLAVEPMTCAPDAFNDEAYPFPTGLTTLEHGESAEAWWRIEVSA